MSVLVRCVFVRLSVCLCAVCRFEGGSFSTSLENARLFERSLHFAAPSVGHMTLAPGPCSRNWLGHLARLLGRIFMRDPCRRSAIYAGTEADTELIRTS